MKILIFRTYPNIMNVKQYNSQEIGMAKSFIRAGHTCDIIYYNGKNKSFVQKISNNEYNDIKLYWVKGHKIFNFGIFCGIREITKNYDTILVSEYEQLTSWLYYTFSKKNVYVYHGQYESNYRNSTGFKHLLFKKIFLNNKKSLDTVIFAKSKLSKETALKNKFKKVFTVGVGIDFERFQSQNTSNKLINELTNKKTNYKYLLYIGVIEDRRNIMFMFDCLKKVLDVDANVKLIIVGNGKKEYIEKCKVYSKNIGVYNNIVYITELDQSAIAQLYKICDVFLLPSKYEIFGMVLLEAMYFKLPVISSKNGGSSTLIPSQDYGIIIEDFDIYKWSNSINNLLMEKELAQNISEKAYENVIENYNWNVIINKYLKEM